MRVYSEQLAEHLSTGLRACYLIFGDEPLQKMESLSLIRQCAKKDGFLDVVRFSAIDEPLPWDDIHHSCQSLSLFSDRQIIEIELGDKLPKEWADKISGLQALLHPDLILIVIGPRLNSNQLKSNWFTVLDKIGIYTPVSLPDARFFPRWMKQRCQTAGLNVAPDAVTYLCHAFEGNILAAAQEIEKLVLLNLPQPITIAALQQNITRHNAFDPFQWLDTLLEGKTQRALRMLMQLRDEGIEPGMLTWAVAKDLELLYALKIATENRQPVAPLFQKSKIWPSRQALFQQTLHRLKRDHLQNMMRMTVELEQANRHFDTALAWQWLETLTLAFKGTSAFQFTLPDQL